MPAKTSTERSRKHRDRKRCGKVVIQDLVISRSGIGLLVARGWLNKEAADDPVQVRAALVKMVKASLNEKPEPETPEPLPGAEIDAIGPKLRAFLMAGPLRARRPCFTASISHNQWLRYSFESPHGIRAFSSHHHAKATASSPGSGFFRPQLHRTLVAFAPVAF
jgi:hypothetical protein